ncbi:MAG: hypothetical protein R3B71_03315 [Candidatus Gracilibacteria bacterium]|nr:hypothetical protein [Candidatus Peregrinibacteria bacterium]
MKYEDELKKMTGMAGQPVQNMAGNAQKTVSNIIKLALIVPIVIMLITGVAVFLFVGNIDNFGMDLAQQFLGDEADRIQQTTEFSGNPAAFDVLAMLPEAQAYAGEGAQLSEIDSYFVSADGTQNFAADYEPPARTTYTFIKTVPPPENAPPTGVDEYYQQIKVEALNPGETRHITSRGGSVNLDYWVTNKGFIRSIGSPTARAPGEFIDAPSCSFADIWQKAIETGVSSEAAANITYDEDGYRFQISTLGVWLEFDQDCNLTLDMNNLGR